MIAYQKLTAWQRAMDLAVEVYRLTREFPSDEKFGMTSQMRRASSSIAFNIAEGYGRTHRGDYLRHLSIARGSCFEVETQILLAIRLDYLDGHTALNAQSLTAETGRLLTALIRSLTPANEPKENTKQTLVPRH